MFFTDARVPSSVVIGEINGGWGVALSTLGFERTGLGAGSGIGFRLSGPRGSQLREQQEITTVGEFIEAAKARARSFGTNSTAMIGGNVAPLVKLATDLGREGDPPVREEIVRLYTLSSVNNWNGLRARATEQAGGRAGAEASLGKLMSSGIARQWRDAARSSRGPGHARRRRRPAGGRVARQFLAAPGPSIYGGSDQIQRNIIGERVLGLPREHDPSGPFRSASSRSVPSPARPRPRASRHDLHFHRRAPAARPAAPALPAGQVALGRGAQADGDRAGYDPQTWSQLAGQLGLQGLIVPEKHGGSGAGPVELPLLSEEMGRALLCAPYFATAVLSVHALLNRGDQAAAEEFLPGMAEGTTIATLAGAEDDGGWATDGVATRARRYGDGLPARRPQVVRDRRARGRPDPGRGPGRRRAEPVRGAG